MAINISVKGILETKVNKAFTALSKKKLASNKNDFIMNCIDTSIDDLYKNKAI